MESWADKKFKQPLKVLKNMKEMIWKSIQEWVVRSTCSMTISGGEFFRFTLRGNFEKRKNFSTDTYNFCPITHFPTFVTSPGDVERVFLSQSFHLFKCSPYVWISIKKMSQMEQKHDHGNLSLSVLIFVNTIFEMWDNWITFPWPIIAAYISLLLWWIDKIWKKQSWQLM